MKTKNFVETEDTVRLKSKLFLTLSLLLAGAGLAVAGSLDSPGTPGSGNGMPTLSGIYNQLDTGATATPAATFQKPLSGPAPTGRTLSEIQGRLPASDNTNGLAPAGAPNGKTFWGLCTDTAGIWGPQTGNNANVVDTGSGDAVPGDIMSGKKAWVDGSEVTGDAPAGSNITGDNGDPEMDIPKGSYSGGKTATAQDTALLAANIAPGVSIFGIVGTHGCTVYGTRWCDLGDGTVMDLTTGLEWQQTDDNNTYNWHVASGTYDATNNAATANVCGELTLDGGGWRLPTSDELFAIIMNPDPVSNTAMHGFTGVDAAYYWSATEPVTQPADPGAYVVSFGDGVFVHIAPYVDGYFVRCVR